MPATIKLSNGLCLLVEERPHTHSVALGCFVRVGARYEPAPLSGISHLIEHMCFKGTRSIPTARQIAQYVEGVGGILDAETSYESTVYWAKVADIHFDRALHVLTELVCAPRFDADELEKERQVIIEEIRGIQDSPDDWIDTLIYESLWGEQPLGRDIAGSAESVGNISHSAMVAFWQQHYTPASLVVSVAGNVETGRVVDAVSAAFGTRPMGEPHDAIPTSAAQPGPQLKIVRRSIEQSHFSLALPALSFHDPDRRALDVLDIVMGGDMSSRLFQELREEQGLAYSVGSYQNKYADAGAWVIYGSVKPTKLTTAIRTILTMLHTLKNEGISEEEVAYVKEQVKGRILLAQEDTWSVASRNGGLQLRYGEVFSLERVVADFEAVTCADVHRVVQRILHRDRLHLVVVGPHKDHAHLRGLMENWNP